MTRKTLSVEGMSCDHCKMAVTRAVGGIEGVSAVQVSLEGKSVSFEYDESSVALETVREAIRGQGYEVVS